eukprot:CAMPEP_0177592938 /NCGR_PEP_ID=MMETSP0419_2-20121207/8840_1 /TAXON_ID=582737 /ORGANISM="Tetraselmis sp., Strain GSL018" /LENGTH=338 /DNA_ID=CAMNT_0019083865 /DNA_START=44 /DNA_END=1057 /DNA_ORIENTATION=-
MSTYLKIQDSCLCLGRQLTTISSFEPGDVVLSEEPFAAVLSDSELSKRCHVTFAPSEKLLRCGKCKLSRFAAREFQALDWKSGGREECAALVASHPRVPPATIRLAARILWRLNRDGGEIELKESLGGVSQHAPNTSSRPQVKDLIDHWEEIPEERKLTYAQMGSILVDYMKAGRGEAAAPCSVRDAALLLAKLACNAMTVFDEDLRPIGTGLYLTAAMANHACAPSCVQSFEGRRLVLRAARALRPGDEVTIAYTELAATRQERRRELREGYFFDLDGAGVGADPLGPAAAELAPEAEVAPGVTLRAFARPAWAEDPADGALTEVRLAPEASGAERW